MYRRYTLFSIAISAIIYFTLTMNHSKNGDHREVCQMIVTSNEVRIEDKENKSLKGKLTTSVRSNNFTKSNTPSVLPFQREEEEEKRDRLKNVGERLKIEYKMVRDPKTGLVPKDAEKKAFAAAAIIEEFQLASSEDGTRSLPTIDITSRGPNNYGGRTRAMAFEMFDDESVGVFQISLMNE